MLQFVGRYPIIAAGSADGTLSLWALSRAPLAYRSTCLGRFLNVDLYFKEPDRFRDKFRQTAVPEPITCGVIEVLEIGMEHCLEHSSALRYEKNTFTWRAQMKPAANVVDDKKSDTSYKYSSRNSFKTSC